MKQHVSFQACTEKGGKGELRMPSFENLTYLLTEK